MTSQVRMVEIYLVGCGLVALAGLALCLAVVGCHQHQWLTLERVLRYGFHQVCHQQPARCCQLLGVGLPICGRCLGLFGGVLAGALVGLIFKPGLHRWLWLLPGLGWLLLAGEVGGEWLGGWAGTNLLRLFTGALAAGFSLYWGAAQLYGREVAATGRDCV